MKIRYFLAFALVTVSILVASCAPAATPAPVQPSAPTNASAPAAPTVAPTEASSAAVEPKKPYNIFMMPKITGNPYFVAANDGAAEAAKELGVNLIWQAPSKGDPNEQVQLIQSAMQQKVDAILVSATDKDALVPVMQQAMKAGILVMTWDADVQPAGRQIFVNQASLEGIGISLAQSLGKIMDYSGDFAIVSSTTTAPNQTAWIEYAMQEMKDPKYANMKLIDTVYGGDQDETAYQAAQGLVTAHPDLKGILAPGSTMIAATARLLQDKGLCGKITLTGLGVPSEMRPYVSNGCVPQFVLWSPPDLGYLSIYTAVRYLDGEITGKEGEKYTAGKLGEYTFIANGEVVLGPGFVFDKNNIDDFQF